jgi:phosphoribosylanthranilate isomerase
MKIKICGINDAVFAAEAARLGVDYLGFIFEPSSPRFVTPEKARSICSSLEQRHKALDSSASLGTRFARLGRFPMGRAHPQGADTRLCVENKPVLVGVFVRETPAEITETMRRTGLDVVQLHRRATNEDVAALKAAGYEVWTLAGGAEGDGVLFDSSHGDGDTAFRKGNFKSIVAGRIGVENVADALALKPDIIDVNSSLETAPGIKSTILLAAFLAEFAKPNT